MEQDINNTQKTKNIRLTSFQKRLIILLSINVIIFLASWIFISKQSGQIIFSSQNIAKFRENQSNINSLMEYIAKMERDIKEIEEDFSKYQNLLVDKRELTDVRKKINDIFLKHKLDPMFSFVTENSPKDKEPGSYGFNLILTGTIDKSLQAIKEVKDLKILMTFDQVIIEKVLPRSVVLPDLDDIGKSNPNTTVPSATIPKTNNYKITIPGKIYLKEAIIEQ